MISIKENKEEREKETDFLQSILIIFACRILFVWPTTRERDVFVFFFFEGLVCVWFCAFSRVIKRTLIVLVFLYKK